MDRWNENEDGDIQEKPSDSFFDDSYEYARDGPKHKRSRKKGRIRNRESNFDGELKHKNFIEAEKKDFIPDDTGSFISDDQEAILPDYTDVSKRTKSRNGKKPYKGKSPEEKKEIYRRRLKAKAGENRQKQKERPDSETQIKESPDNRILSETSESDMFYSDLNDRDSGVNPAVLHADQYMDQSVKDKSPVISGRTNVSLNDGKKDIKVMESLDETENHRSKVNPIGKEASKSRSEYAVSPESGVRAEITSVTKQEKKLSFALFGNDDTETDLTGKTRNRNTVNSTSDNGLFDTGLRATALAIRKTGEVISKSTGEKDDSAATETLRLGSQAGNAVSKYGFYVAEDTAEDIFKSSSKPKKKVSDYTGDSVFEVKKKEITKEEQKKHDYRKRLRKRHQNEYRKAKRAAAETGKKTAEESRKLLGIAKSAVQAFIAAVPRTLLVIALLILILVLFGGEMAGSVVSLTTETASILSAASYHSDPYMIDQADLTMSYKELMLRDRIDEIEDEYPDYEEYSYTIGNIGHDPFALINYLSAEYGEITPDVMDSIDGLFNSMYYLKILAIDDVRYRWVIKPPEEDDEEDLEENEEDDDDEESEDDGEEDEDDEEPEYILEEYIVKVLKVELQSKSLESIAETRLADNSFKKTVYQILNITHGLTQYIGTPVWNTWSVRSYYGYRRNPGGNYDELHRGLDIELPYGSNVQSAISGEVMEVSSDPMYGEYIVIEDIGTRYKVKYANLGRVSVIEGERVFMGQTIGRTGGGNEGSCLHMEFLINNNYMNPLFYTNNPIPDG